jgi:dihydroorotase
VTCEVTPHHLLLSDQDIPADDGNYKMNPPLRSEHDRQALIIGLLDGTIDCIATDHAPHSDAEKQQSMRQAPFGIIGSEMAFSLLYTNFVKTRIFTLKQLINWLSQKPAQIFQLATSGQLSVGQPADIAVFDLDHPYQITAASLLSKGHNTPFIDTQVCGETVYTFVAGQIAYQRGGTK